MNRWLSGALTALVLIFTAGTIVTWATGNLTIPNTIFTQPNPVPTSLLDQNWAAVASYVNARQVTFDVLVNRPVAGTAGRYYFATDQNGGTLFADNGTSWVTIAAPVGAVLVTSISSMTLTNHTGATASFDVLPGTATSDDAAVSDRVLMVIPTTFGGINKKLTAWATTYVGGSQISGSGCLDTGAVAAFTWYHVFAINRPDLGTTDILCSTSATSPTMPANYTKKRRVGAIRTTWFPTPGAEIYPFSQVGDRFVWATRSTTHDVNNGAPGTGAITATLSTPNGVSTLALMEVHGPAAGSLAVTDLNTSDEVLNTCGTTAAGAQAFCQVQAMTDNASSIRIRSTVNSQIDVITYGWFDRRGQQ